MKIETKDNGSGVMIYVEVQGNLGNQLFQYAYARHIQKHTKQGIILNLYNFNKGRPDLEFTLNQFVLNDTVFIEKDRPLPYYANSFTVFSRIMRKICPQLYHNILKKFGIIMWQESKVIEDPKFIYQNYYLSGWFQSIKYFKDVREELINEIIPQNINCDNQNLYKEIRNTNSVCISIRRGDYVTNERISKLFYVCDEKYFFEAIKKIQQKEKNLVFVFFSDDIEWVKKNIYIKGKCLYETGKDSVGEKLRLMSACKHYILSNSSFSWWAQFIRVREGGYTIAPKRWNNTSDNREIYDSDWILIDTQEDK